MFFISELFSHYLQKAQWFRSHGPKGQPWTALIRPLTVGCPVVSEAGAAVVGDRTVRQVAVAIVGGSTGDH